MNNFDIVIIGAGVIGSFIARSASKYNLNVLVIEKENDVGNVTSMSNSAIVHSGYDPKPGTLKAKFNVLGNKMFDQLSKELDFSFERIGSMTIAFSDEDMNKLKELQERAKLNGVETKLLTKEETIALEPGINPNVFGSLLAPTAGIVDTFNLVAHAMENACDNGVVLHLNETFLSLDKDGDEYLIKTNKDIYKTKVVINAAGLQSDEIFELSDEDKFSITPRKGEYFLLGHITFKWCKHTLFPLPSEKGKGILISPTYSGEYLVGPSSEFVSSKDDFDTDTLTLNNVRANAFQIMPNLPIFSSIRTFSGLRATPSTHDFVIKELSDKKGVIMCGGIESPGLTAAPAIGEYVINELVSKRLTLVKKDNYNPCVRPYLSRKKMSVDDYNELVKKDPNYGVNVCNCEEVTLGEIIDVMSRSVPCLSIKSIKKRTRAGMGRCQSGMCQPFTLFTMAKILNKKPEEILYDNEDSNILFRSTKGEN